jgi:hypothetical protein
MKKTAYIQQLALTVVMSIVVLSCSKEPSGGGTTPTPTPTPTIEAPGKATLSTPENNKACEELNSAGQVSFSWNASTETDSYDLKITNLNNQQQINQNNITSTSKAVTLTKGIPYSWNITSKNKGDKTPQVRHLAVLPSRRWRSELCTLSSTTHKSSTRITGDSYRWSDYPRVEWIGCRR